MRAAWIIITSLAAMFLAACGGSVRMEDGIGQRVDVSHIPDARPRNEPPSKYGNPSSYVVNGKRYYVKTSSKGYVEQGIASWYGTKFHGRRTSSGEPYNMYAMTAAHKTLPLPTYVKVTNLKNGRSVVVKVNDRGPFHQNRLIDLSYAAAEKLNIVGNGTGFVEVRAIDPSAPTRPYTTVAESKPAASIPAPSTSDNGRIFIQVGAFSQRSNAERLVSRLPKTLGTVLIREGWSSQNRVYRVQVGPIASVEQADSLASVIEKIGVMNYHLVVE